MSEHSTKIADISMVVLVYYRVKVRIPRSHKITLGLPAAKMYLDDAQFLLMGCQIS